jgi:hypothetical protein
MNVRTGEVLGAVEEAQGVGGGEDGRVDQFAQRVDLAYVVRYRGGPALGLPRLPLGLQVLDEGLKEGPVPGHRDGQVPHQVEPVLPVHLRHVSTRPVLTDAGVCRVVCCVSCLGTWGKGERPAGSAHGECDPVGRALIVRRFGLAKEIGKDLNEGHHAQGVSTSGC